ncbi:hypothetical protein B0H16DRAFT_1727512 [Mycena metata]|uniref:Uncharacterized protein n=1 Tax=Mycena metata TaxID=1033252 RepID=A0AAD7IKD8_9AGAR|nr:hypothetical protein B0H16DRAFT_1727512 [Mycena metata]
MPLAAAALSAIVRRPAPPCAPIAIPDVGPPRRRPRITQGAITRRPVPPGAPIAIPDVGACSKIHEKLTIKSCINGRPRITQSAIARRPAPPGAPIAIPDVGTPAEPLAQNPR